MPAWRTSHAEEVLLALLLASTVSTLCVHTFKLTRYCAKA